VSAKITVCCQSFEGSLNEMGRRGFSHIVEEYEGVFYFRMQGRAVDAGQSLALPTSGSGRVSTVFQTGMRYCPSCGADLRAWLDTHPSEARNLAARSEPYLMA